MSRIVIAGWGMVGHRMAVALIDAGFTAGGGEIVVFGEEPHPAYDRVGLSSCFDGRDPDDLTLVGPGFGDLPGVVLRPGEKVAAIDRGRGRVTTAGGEEWAYDHLVLATGSYPFVPPMPGTDAHGCFTYRTIDDVATITNFAKGCQTGIVIGGGLLGLEAAGALRHLGLHVSVVEFAPRLMPVQVDDGGGAALRGRIEALGVDVFTGHQTAEVLATRDGRAAGLRFAKRPHWDGTPGEDDTLLADIVVISAGIRPRDELARDAGLTVHERGGIVVDECLTTSDPNISAIGECALAQGRIFGLVAPGYEMARTLAARLTGDTSATFTGADMSTRLKLLGVEVASFGDSTGATPGAQSVVYADGPGGVYQRLVVADGAVVGGILVGDASAYPSLTAMARGDMPTPEHPEHLLSCATSAASGGALSLGVDGLPGEAMICSCHSVSKGAICAAFAEGARDLGSIKAVTKAATGCGGCAPLCNEILAFEKKNAGIPVLNYICEHFTYSRHELMDIVRVERLSSFSEVLATRGRGRGCEVCKPAVASMLASLARHDYILDGEASTLQDTNDHFLANMQKDGTYSVVPRVPGGEITPDQLIALGQIAKEFGLYTKITGAQRIDLFGARVEQLPHIWRRVVDAGMESGHAYGKALRTVKSCVGSTWCRFGVQDSTAMAIEIELRYRGLRAPHKVKAAVSGCTRECAEAQGKDIGVIATEQGWNLYVCGNGGMRPAHAVLLAADLDAETLIRYIDRFFMFYIRTADRLERTSVWFSKLEGGIDYLRRVVIDDALGIAAELEADMERHVETYRCEWAATLEDPARLARFRTYVNSDDPDPGVVFVPERGQVRPARPEERISLELGVRS